MSTTGIILISFWLMGVFTGYMWAILSKKKYKSLEIPKETIIKVPVIKDITAAVQEKKAQIQAFVNEEEYKKNEFFN